MGYVDSFESVAQTENMIETSGFDSDNDITTKLLDEKVFSRIAAQDPTLYSFDPVAERYARDYFGWTDLASNPPVSPGDIAAFAAHARAEGLEAVVLIGQGGSTQASMTITKLNALVNEHVVFKTMDSISPVYVRKILRECNPEKTIYIFSSKSGGTLEPTMLSRIAWDYVVDAIGAEAAPRRFVAITDPGTKLEQMATEQGWRAIFHGSPNVGGRFSALSVFGLVPASLVGIDIIDLLQEATTCEKLCSQDTPDNPALKLASFLYDNYRSGRRIFSLVSPQPGRVFGLWVEQLIAESLGKNGKGIMPNIEVDAGMLALPHPDRCAITYAIRPDASFESDISRINSSIPTIHCAIPNVTQIACHFIMWEYAVAAVAKLMEVSPFDQPDVQLTKDIAKAMLSGTLDKAFVEGRSMLPSDDSLVLEAEMTDAVTSQTPASLDEAFEQLFESLRPSGFFSLNAFLPFYLQERRVPLEEIRHVASAQLGVVSCLEIGPRYLHSTGQFHKGGEDMGVFLILSAEEEEDMAVPGEQYTLGAFAHAQACADMAALSYKGRRALRLHLADNSGKTLAHISARICAAACRVAARR